MPILRNAKKALRVNARRRAINTKVRTRVKTFTDKVKKSNVLTDLPASFSAIDKAVKKKLIHKNKAARLKSSLAKRLSAAGKATTGKKK